MKTIAYIVNSLIQTGPIIVLRDIIRYIDRSKIRPIIICLRHESANNPIIEEMNSLEVKCIYLNYSLWFLEFFTKKVADKVLSILQKEKADILHSHCYHPDLIAAILSKDIMCISTLHNISKDDFTFLKGSVVGNYMNMRYLLNFPRIGNYAAISNIVADYYTSYVKGSKQIRTIYNGVDLSRFQIPDKGEKQLLRKRMNLPESGKIYVVVGRLFSRKDPLIIIRAFVSLLKSCRIPRDCFLFFVGDGPLKTMCQKAIGTESNNIKLLGFQQNVHEWIRAADYSITASHSEGFGLNYLEAIVCGNPVIASDLPPFREISGTNAREKDLFFPKGNQKELEDCIIKSLTYTLPQERVTAIRHRFSSETMSKRYQELYEELL